MGNRVTSRVLCGWLTLLCLVAAVPAVVLADAPAAVPAVLSSTVSADRIAVDRNGDIYVADARALAVRVLSRSGAPLRTVEIKGAPTAVAVTASGRLVVADREQGRVDVMDGYGGLITTLGRGTGEFQLPLGVAESAVDGRIYVADARAETIRVYGADGVHHFNIAVTGTLVTDLAISAGHVYASDTKNSQVLVYSTAGVFERRIGSFGVGMGELTRPAGLDIGPDGNLYVVDAYQSRIAVFGADGTFLRFLGRFGTGKGELAQPLDVAADPAGSIIIADSGNVRLQAWMLLTPPNPADAVRVFPAEPPVVEAPRQADTRAAPATGGQAPARTDQNCAQSAPVDLAALGVLVALWGLARRRRAAGLIALGLVLLPRASLALDAPHDTSRLPTACAQCHTPHNAPGAAITTTAGNSNLCLTCHATMALTTPSWAGTDQAIPGTSGSSHRWDALMVNATYNAAAPTDAEMLLRTEGTGATARLMCSTCHNQHSQQLTPFDPASSATAGANNRHYMRAANNTAQMCLQCHGAWNQAPQRGAWAAASNYVHPVNTVHPVADPLMYPVPRDTTNNPQSAILRGAATTTAAGTGTMTDSTAAFPANLGTVPAGGHKIRFTTGSNKGRVCTITTNAATSANWVAAACTVNGAASAQTVAIALGDRYEIDQDGNFTNNLALDNAGNRSFTAGNVVCTTCHGLHYADSNSATYDDKPQAGDGKLLRRTNSDLACNGCHRELTHSSATTSTTYGVWGATFTCTTCHQAHRTGNIWLVKGTIATPNSGNKAVDFRNMTGKADFSYATSTTPGNGVCEVCHTLTRNTDGSARFRNTGGSDGGQHFSGKCTTCHQHTNGFASSCTSCHGNPPANGTHATHVGVLTSGTYGGLQLASDVGPNPTGYGFGCGYCHPLNIAKHMNGTNGGKAEVELYDATAPAGNLKLRSTTASYTYGGTTFNEVGFTTPVPYTLGTCSNVACHSGPKFDTTGNAPYTTVPQPALTGNGTTTFTWNPAVWPIVYPAGSYTVAETRTYSSVTWGAAALTCGSCHGNPIRSTSRSAVPAGTNDGAGDTHSWIDQYGYENDHAWNMGFTALQCRTCHYATVQGSATVTRNALGVSTYGDITPKNNTTFNFAKHVNGVKDVAFDTVNTYPYAGATFSLTPNLTTATWTAASKTCSNVECHNHPATEPKLYESSVVWGTPYRWENAFECNVCHRK
ncbi:MAG: CxxxxCH/CxxCH domain-containing protein [Deltaproteobacteria bacterium]|nr:CxxxxCH/CxxCH domain-containing protein [Deltaproteobacteria bacterium]